MKRITLLFLSLILCLGNGLTPKAQEPEKKQVLTTFYPVYYLAKRIAGDQAEVSMLLDGGQDAHDYESSAQDVACLQAADLFIYQDDEMEHFVSDLVQLADTDRTEVLKASQGIDLMAGSDHDHESHDHEGEAVDHDHEGQENHDHEGEAGDHDHDHQGHHHEFDPHTWLDPELYAKEAENVRDALCKIDPDHAEIYQANTQKLIDELKDLDQEFQAALARREDRRIVVQHAAFAYLAEAYDLEQVAITGLSTDAEPSAKTLAEMQNFIKHEGIQVIYVDPALNTSISDTVAQATEAKLLPLRTLEIVTAEEEAAGEDYLSLMRANLKVLTEE